MKMKWLAAALPMWPLLAWSCGICDEDTVAATYDHAVVARAAAGRQTVVFVAVDAAVEPHAFERRIATVAPRIRGVVRNSVRTASAPLGFSFAMNPATQSPAAAVAELSGLLHVEPALRIVQIVSTPMPR
ncbi:MAG: hypothetical protein ABJA83_14165 [Burkholderiaceae bacterium]